MEVDQTKHPTTTLKSVLEQFGLDPEVWEAKFHKYNVSEPHDIATIEKDYALYNELAVNASEDEDLALQKLLSVDLPNEQDVSSSMIKELENKLQDSGFDISYWLSQFVTVLGIQSPEALDYLGNESYSLLEPYVRNTNDKIVLKAFFQLNQQTSFQERRRLQLEKVQKRNEKLKEILMRLNTSTGKHNNIHKRTICELLQTSSVLPSEMSAIDWINKLNVMVEELPASSTELSADELLKSTSILQGTLMMNDHSQTLIENKNLLKAPFEVQLLHPKWCQFSKIINFHEERAELAFLQTMKNYGITAMVQYEGNNDVPMHKVDYISTIQCTIVPMASCYINNEDLQLSPEALTELKAVEELNNTDDARAKTVKFLHDYGSHAFKGIHHFGGVFICTSYSKDDHEFDSKSAADIHCKLNQLLIKKTFLPESLLGSCSEISNNDSHNSNWKVHPLGGPSDFSSFCQWKLHLVATNATWNLIDRGNIAVPVWEIIQMNHKDLKGSLAALIQNTWEELNFSQSPFVYSDYSPPMQNAMTQKKNADILDREVTGWNIQLKQSEIEACLHILMEAKKELINNLINPIAWSNFYLSKPAIRQYITWAVSVNRNKEYVLVLVKQLVTPLDLHILNCEDFTGLLKMKLYNSSTKQIIKLRCGDFINLQSVVKFMSEQLKDAAVENSTELRYHQTQYMQISIKQLINYLVEAEQHYELMFLYTLLYPFGYDKQEQMFWHLLSSDELEYLSKQLEEPTVAFFDIGYEEKVKLQACLFYLTFKAIGDSQISDLFPRAKAHVEYLKNELKSELVPQISDKLGVLYDINSDWINKLESDMLILYKGFKPHTARAEHSLLQLLGNDGKKEGFGKEKALETKDSLDINGIPQQHSMSIKSADMVITKSQISAEICKFKLLLELLKLKEKHPDKLTKNDAMVIRFSTLGNVKSTKQLELLPYVVMQKIMVCDSKCRSCLYSGSIDIKDQLCDYNQSSDQDSNSDSSSSDSDSETCNSVSPFDVILALLHCSDNFLRQDLIRKLSMCQFAIPCVLPNPLQREIKFLIWSMRSIIKTWICQTGDSIVHKECAIVDYKAPVITFLRIGRSKVSKSEFLNYVVSDSNHDFFFKWNCDGGNYERLIADGVVDLCWYLPQGNDKDFYPDLLTFLNLHGDALNHSMQLKLINSISSMMIFLVGKGNKLCEASISLLGKLESVPILLFTSKNTYKNVGKQLNQSSINFTGFLIKGKTNAEIRIKLQTHIKERFQPPYPVKHFSLVDCSQIADNLGFMVDEKHKSIEISKGLARNVMNEIAHHPSTEAKSALLLLQGPLLWHQWAKHDKERSRHVFKHKTSIEQYNSQKDSEKLAIRQQQLECSELLPQVMKLFLDNLLSHEGNIRKYFIEWMKIFLDDYSRSVLPQFYRTYKDIRATLMHLKDKLSEGSSELKQLKLQLKRQNEYLAYASFGLEHFFREIGQIYEARMDPLQTSIPKSLKDSLQRLPKMAASLIDEGYGMEVMDGDASHVPITWISAIMDELKSLHEHKKLFTISVLGIQSTGKSTLLNTMFGLQFHASAGRCTRGVFLQLLKVDDEIKKKFKCDLIMVIDTEGLRAPELQFEGTQTHDNELATFVIGLADVTIVNIYGEAPGDLDDILQTAVHAFIRMKKMTLYPRCHFVHQNVSEVTSNKSQMGRQKFLDGLDKITLSAAVLEHSEGQFKSFKHIISFNEETDVHYFPALWKGDPPMAPVNPGYSEKAQFLRHTMVQQSIKPHERMSKEMATKSTTFIEFKARLKYIWEAVLHENFIFSFKSSLEIVAYNELDVALNKWSWKFQECMQSWQCEAENKIYNAKDAKELKKVAQECHTDAIVKSSDILKMVMADLLAFFDENEHAVTLAQWKGRTEEKIKRLHSDFDENALTLCKNLQIRKQECFKLQHLKKDQHSKVQKQLNELVIKSKCEGKDLTDEQLVKTFEANWKQWKEDFSQVQFTSDEEIDQAAENALKNIFRPQFSEIMQSLNKQSLSNRKLSHKFCVNSKEHLISCRWSRWLFFPTVYHEDEILAEDKTREFVKVINHSSLSEDCKNFSEGMITAPLNELKRMIFQFNKGKRTYHFAFSPTYTVDIAIYVSVHITHRCKSMMKEYRKKNDPLVSLEDQKTTFFNTYKSQYKDASCDKTAADNFCRLLSKQIESQVIRVFPKEVISFMKEKSTFQSKKGLKCKILEDLATEGNFHKYSLYLDNAEESYKEWAESYIENYCNMRTTVGEKTKLVEISTRLTDQTFQKIKSVVKETPKNVALIEWLEQFHSNLNGAIQLDITDLTGAIGYEQLTDYEFFVEEIEKGLTKSISTMKISIESPRSRLVRDLITKAKNSVNLLLHEPLSGISLTGCTARCPFCKEFCEFSDPNHSAEQELHSLKIHRPQCLGKYRNDYTEELIVEHCSSLVGSEGSFRCCDTNQQYVKYKQYKTIYPNWHIVYDTVQVPDYWKWFVATYNRQLAVWASARDAVVPREWYRIEKAGAIKSIKETYHS